MNRHLMSILVLVCACGNKKPATTATEPQHADTMKMSPELSKFHDVLAPRWHADKGPQRMKDTCGALPDFHANADALAKAPPPSAAKADTWSAGTTQLVDALSGLDKTCSANDATSFETAFAKVHESFHGLLAASGMHEMHEEGEGQGKHAHGNNDDDDEDDGEQAPRKK